MHGDFYELFHRFWWLIFPILGMGMGMISMWQRHARANRTIDIIKSYADQGKEPPPELLAALRDPHFSGHARKTPSWSSVFLFAALAIGFVMFALVESGDEVEAMVPFLFVALIMVALCVGKLINLLSWQKRDGNSRQ